MVLMFDLCRHDVQSRGADHPASPSSAPKSDCCCRRNAPHASLHLRHQSPHRSAPYPVLGGRAQRGTGTTATTVTAAATTGRYLFSGLLAAHQYFIAQSTIQVIAGLVIGFYHPVNHRGSPQDDQGESSSKHT